MPKGDKYIALTNFLEKCNDDKVTLSIEEINKIVGGTLLASAYKYREAWNDGHGGSLSFAWLNAGYSARQNFRTKEVTFTKSTIGENGAAKKYPPAQPQLPARLDINRALNSIRRYHEAGIYEGYTRFRSWGALL